MATAFAAVVAAQLRNLGVAIGVALLISVITGVVQRFVNADSDVAAKLVPSVPFVLMLLFLIYHAFRGQASDLVSSGGLDHAASALRPTRTSPAQGLLRPAAVAQARVHRGRDRIRGDRDPAHRSRHEYWTARITAGICLAIAMLSYTLVVGEGGMVWLSQITFAGLGAIIAAGQPPTRAGPRSWPLWRRPSWSPLSVCSSALSPSGCGDLYVALVTLSFGLLDHHTGVHHRQHRQLRHGCGAVAPRLRLRQHLFAYLALAVFAVVACSESSTFAAPPPVWRSAPCGGARTVRAHSD